MHYSGRYTYHFQKVQSLEEEELFRLMLNPDEEEAILLKNFLWRD